MGLFANLFKSKVSMEALQKAMSQERYADAVYLAGELAGQALSTADVERVDAFAIAAGDALARRNLQEALTCLRLNDKDQAQIHFDLALEQVRSGDLRDEIEGFQGQDAVPVLPPPAVVSKGGDGPSFAASGVKRATEETITNDEDIQLELILTSYPEGFRRGYLDKGALFKKAFLLAQEGQDDQALLLFEQVSEEERDSYYLFELGALHARTGCTEQAVTELKRALAGMDDVTLPLQTLTDVLMEKDQVAEARRIVTQILLRQPDSSFCHALLAAIEAREQRWEEAAGHVRRALDGGYLQSGFLPVAASVMEQVGQHQEAESLLKLLPGQGCKSGMHPLLAEFYLRHGRELEKASASFNSALTREPDNPRWLLRLAQSFVARGRVKDGTLMLKELAAVSDLSPSLLQEVKVSLEEAVRRE